VLDKGVGRPVVLIHGLGGQMRNFTHSLVGRLCGDFRVVAFDRPGSGYSTRSADAPAGVRAQAATLAKAIRALKLERPVIVGHSLGGAFALAIALDYPDCVGAVALISPATHPAPPAPRKQPKRRMWRSRRVGSAAHSRTLSPRKRASSGSGIRR
jgi:pimeloyl-ACP methyl ester carboxylesterase